MSAADFYEHTQSVSTNPTSERGTTFHHLHLHLGHLADAFVQGNLQ